MTPPQEQAEWVCLQCASKAMAAVGDWAAGWLVIEDDDHRVVLCSTKCAIDFFDDDAQQMIEQLRADLQQRTEEAAGFKHLYDEMCKNYSASEASLRHVTEERDELEVMLRGGSKGGAVIVGAYEQIDVEIAVRDGYLNRAEVAEAALRDLQAKQQALVEYAVHKRECDLNKEVRWVEAVMGDGGVKGVRALEESERAAIKAARVCTCGLSTLLGSGGSAETEPKETETP